MSFNVQGSLLGDLLRARVNISTDSFRLLLLGDTYEWNWSHNRRDDLSDELATGGGYTSGGVAVTLSDTVDTTNQISILTITGVNLAGPITGARWGAVVQWGGGSASNDILIGVHDWGRILPPGPIVLAAATISHYR